MKTGYRRNPEQMLGMIVAAIILATMACNLPSQFQTATRESESPTENPAQDSVSPSLTPTENPVPQNNLPSSCLAGINPGTTTRTEVITVLKEPVFSQQDSDFEVLFYDSSLKRQYNTVVLRNQVVERVGVVLGEANILLWSTVKTQLGEPPVKAFSTYDQGSRLFAYPERGVEFIASEDLDTVFAQDCFVPMSLDAYKAAFGSLLLAEDPFIQ